MKQGNELFGVSLEQQIACVKREIAMRKRVYPKWVETERMSQHKADTELEHMGAVLLTLESVLVGYPAGPLVENQEETLPERVSRLEDELTNMKERFAILLRALDDEEALPVVRKAVERMEGEK